MDNTNQIKQLESKYKFVLECDLIPYEHIPDTIKEVSDDLQKINSVISKNNNNDLVNTCVKLKRVSERLPAPAVTEQSCGLLNKENSEAVVDIQSIDRSPTISSTYKPPLPAPSQDKIKSDISVLLNDIVVLENLKNSGLINDETLKEFKLKKTKVIKLQKIIKRKEREMVRHRSRRLQRKRAIEKLSITNPDLKKKLNIRDAIGRPRIESDQPFLLQTIINLALKGSAAHERRRDETIRTVKTLDDLVDKLREDYGFTLSRSTTYLRLLPRKSNSTEGKRHVSTVPVKLIKSTNDLHRQHSDSKFALTTIHHIEEIASILGPNEVTFISQDDKAKIPIELPAVAKQAPFEFCGFVIISHKTVIQFSRSSKYSSSTAFSHARDIENIYDKSEFIQFTHTASKPKPVFIDIVDGGPDENPRYEKVIQMYIHHFLKCDLDAVFVACNAPGRSAFNRVERRMAPLSKALCGIILPHDHFGTHLDDQGRTIDIGLEKTNFSFAGTALAEV
ncbi:hypothetical protein Bhyg_12155 [Pseudolycoriella hygida]|uniref:Uncharacterized protein n=1 Tax=Pseudolycoriella hygida TaxID=35572 RepID=A0A9Q0MWQ1_9DIPT|nr:hypothetical protein Bhyg_12155 [Pseudolycoriella hygida]